MLQRNRSQRSRAYPARAQPSLLCARKQLCSPQSSASRGTVPLVLRLSCPCELHIRIHIERHPFAQKTVEIRNQNPRLFFRRGKSVALRSDRDTVQAAQSARAPRQYWSDVNAGNATIKGT